MSKIVKIGIGLFLGLSIAIGVLLYVVSQKIKPDDIKKMVVDAVERSLPETSVHLEKVDYSLGASISILIDNFDLRLKAPKSKLFNVAKIEVKLPIWAILTGGGAITVNVKDPNAYYLGINSDEFNWDKAIPKSTPSAETKKEDSSKSIQIPSFVKNSRIDVKVTDMNVEYTPYKAKASNIKVTKILLKNINLKTSTAFEITSDIKYALDAQKNLSTNLQIIGEVNIGKFLEEKSLSTTVITNLVDTKMTGMAFNIPDFENKLKVNIKPDGVIETQSELKLGNLIEAKINATLSGDNLNVSKVEMTAFLANAENVLPDELKEKLKMIDLSKSNFNLEGSAKVGLKPLKLNPNFSMEVKNPIGLKLDNSISTGTTFKGTIKGKNVNMKLMTEALSGSVSTAFSTEIDPLNLPSKLSNYPLSKIDVLVTNIKLSRDFLQKTIYGGKKAAEEPALQQKNVAPGEKVDLPPARITLEGKNIFVDKEELEFDSLINASGNEVESKKFEIRYSRGKTNLNFKTKLVDTNNIKNNFSLNMKSMNMSALNSLLPPFISNVSGIYEGDIQGSVDLLSSGLKYDIKAKLSAINGDLKDLDVEKLVASFFDGLKDKVPKQYKKVTNNFDKLSIDVHATSTNVTVNKFLMVGDKTSAIIDLAGNVSMMDKHSGLKGNIMLDSTKAQLQKEFGVEMWPARFAGDGFIMKPDVGYTLNILADKKFQMAKKQAEQEVKKSVEKEGKKEIKKLEKKAKDFFKGIKL